MSPASACRPRRGMGRLEILIVLLVMGVLAALAVPKLANGAQVLRESRLKEQLRFLRTQIGLYGSQHLVVFPGYPDGEITQRPSAATFVEQLTHPTDEQGHTAAQRSERHCFGPYLEAIPANPLNNSAIVKILGPRDSFVADGISGWLYQPVTGQLEPNVPATDSEGRLFSDY